MTPPTGRWSFTDDPIVAAHHLMQMQADRANGDYAVARSALGTGIASGLALATNSPPSMTLQLQPGVAFNADGRRMEIALATSVNTGFDNTTGTPLSTIPPSGSVRWVSVVLRPYDQLVPADTGAGQPFDRVVESQQIKVIAGATAAPGAAVLPAIHTDDVLLGSVLVTSSTTAVRAEDVSCEGVLRARNATDVFAASSDRMLEATPTDPPSLRIKVAPGVFYVDGEAIYHDGTLMPMQFVPDPTYFLTALLSYDPTATPSPFVITYGPAATSPSGATRPTTTGLFPIAFVLLTPGATKVTADKITDARPRFARDRAYFRRFFYTVSSGTVTTLALPFSYHPDTVVGSLAVSVNGVRLYQGFGYNEIDPQHITFTPGIGTGSSILIEAIVAHDPHQTALAEIAETLDGILVGGAVTVQDRGAGLHTYVKPISLMTIAKGVFTQDAEAVLAATAFAPSTFQYLYASHGTVPGTLVFSFSTQAPDASLTWMGSVGRAPNRAYRYLAALRADPAGNLLPGTFRQREARYAPSARAIGAFEVTPSSPGLSQMYLSGFAPPFACRVRLDVKTVGAGGGSGLVKVRRFGDTGAWIVAGFSPSGEAWSTIEIECDTAQMIESDTSDTFVTSANFYARGWHAP